MSAIPLLSESLVQQLRNMRRLFGSELRLWRRGAVASRLPGTGSEFVEQRRYTVGDDLRKLDWFASARRGEPMIRVCRNDEDAVVRILLDTSGSLACGEPPKFDCAKRLSAALGYLALLHGHRLQLLTPQRRLVRPVNGSALIHGAHAAGAWVNQISDLRASGPVALDAWFSSTARLPLRPSRLVVISDFVSQPDILPALSRLAERGHVLVLLQVFDRAEFNWSALGDVLLEDSETHARRALFVMPTQVAEYQATIRAQALRLQRWSRASRARYALVPSTEAPLATITRLLSDTSPTDLDSFDHA